jgi:hypothetical protein
MPEWDKNLRRGVNTMKLPKKVRQFIESKGYEIIEVERGAVISPLLAGEGEKVILVNGKPQWSTEGGGKWVRVTLTKKGDAIAVEDEHAALLFVAR